MAARQPFRGTTGQRRAAPSPRRRRPTGGDPPRRASTRGRGGRRRATTRSASRAFARARPATRAFARARPATRAFASARHATPTGISPRTAGTRSARYPNHSLSSQSCLDSARSSVSSRYLPLSTVPFPSSADSEGHRAYTLRMQAAITVGGWCSRGAAFSFVPFSWRYCVMRRNPAPAALNERVGVEPAAFTRCGRFRQLFEKRAPRDPRMIADGDIEVPERVRSRACHRRRLRETRGDVDAV